MLIKAFIVGRVPPRRVRLFVSAVIAMHEAIYWSRLLRASQGRAPLQSFTQNLQNQ